MVIKERNIHRYLIFSIILVLVTGLFVDVFGLSTAKYASISLELFNNGDWLHINTQNARFSDQPLLFWLPILSFKLFGVSNFSYKLFGVVFTFIGIYSTFQLTKTYYGQRAGRIAAIILGSTQGLTTLALNWQPNTILFGSIIFSVWQIIVYLRNHQTKNFLLGIIGISFAMLAQGVIGLLIPIFIIGGDLVLRQKWKDIFKWQWVLGFIIIACFLAPMIYALDKQLIISGSSYSGIDLFLSRHLGQPNQTPQNYFNFLWGFLPWIILFTLAFIDKVTQSFGPNIEKNTRKYPENISIMGIIIQLLILLTMNFHADSLYLLAPFCAILTAAYLDKITKKNQHFLHKSQAFLIFVLWMLLFLLLFYIFTPVKFVVAMISILLFALTIWSFIKLSQKNALVVGTAIWSIGLGFIQNEHIYPRLSNYQSGVQVGKWLKEHPKEAEQFSNFRILSYTENFYSQKVIGTKRKISQLSSKDRFLSTDEIGLSMIKKAKIPFLIMKTYNQTNVSSLNLTFLNPKTRHEALKKRYLIAIYPQGK